MKITTAFILIVCTAIFQASCQQGKTPGQTEIPSIRLPEGFRISYFARDVGNARSLALGDKGTVFVGTREDKVHALTDRDGDGKADEKHTIAVNLNSPNGVAFRDGALYVAEIDKIWRYDNIEASLATPPKPVLVFDSLPDDGHHGWKYIAFGPDGKLYIPVGAPCNLCDKRSEDARYASICRINADGSGFEIFAHGIRNTVGFDWQPGTETLWFTDNGTDMMGDDFPPDELNKAEAPGMDFGYPYCHAGDSPDPKFGEGHDCSKYRKPEARLAPHTAALGMKFYRGSMFPSAYRKIFIAEHGSWNRSKPIGYRVTMVDPATGKYDVFAEGWLKGNDASGRPVDVLELKDGSLLVSDDYSNAIYRITYKK